LQIAEDFAAMYPRVADKLCSLWPSLALKLRHQLAGVKDKELRKMMSSLTATSVETSAGNNTSPGT
jgi:hypothetical protein